MTYEALRAQDFASPGRGQLAGVSRQGLLCALVLLLGAPTGLWLLYGQPGAFSSTIQEFAARDLYAGASRPPSQATTTLGLSAAMRATGRKTQAMSLVGATPPLRHHLATLFDPFLTSGVQPTTFARSAPLHAGFQPPIVLAEAASNVPNLPAVANTPALPATEPPTALPLPPFPTRDVPLPRPRPGSFLPAYEVATRATDLQRMAAKPASPSDHPSFFERLFGGPREPSTALAYAAPEDGALGRGGLGGVLVDRASPERTTAVYNIATHTVTLPDGTKLEAHSGLGASLDDPRSVAQHMRGATPPNVYDLEPRALMFHGVRALRLNPIGGTTYGRLGLLAHTYMLGPRGDSNGCVVFKNYQAFLDAYEHGKVTRLAVVAGLT